MGLLPRSRPSDYLLHLPKGAQKRDSGQSEENRIHSYKISVGAPPISANLTVLLFVAVDVDLDFSVDLDYRAMRELSQT